MAIMDIYNGHDKHLVELVNRIYDLPERKTAMSAILLALAIRDRGEIEDKFNCDAPANLDDAWDWAHNILENVCDDEDLEVVIKFAGRFIGNEREEKTMNKNISFADNVKSLRNAIVNAIIMEIQNSGRCGCELDNLLITYTIQSSGCLPLMHLKSLRVNDKKELTCVVMHDGGEIFTLSQSELTENVMVDCLTDIYNNVVCTISHRRKKMDELEKLMQKCNGEMKFDGNFMFKGMDYDQCLYECENVRLMGISVNKEGGFLIDSMWNGDDYINGEDFITDDDLDRFIDYVRNQCDCKFEVREEKNHLIVDVHGNAKPVFVAVNTIDYNGDYPTIQVCYGYDECEKIGWGKDITKQLNVGETKEEEVMYGKNATITRVA